MILRKPAAASPLCLAYRLALQGSFPAAKPAATPATSRSGKLWAPDPELCVHSFDKASAVLAAFHFDPAFGPPARLSAILRQLDRDGLIRTAIDQATFATLSDPSAAARNGPLATARAAAPLLPPVDHATMPYLDPCGVLQHLRGAPGWKFVFAAALIGCDPFLEEDHRPLWSMAPPVPPPPHDAPVVAKLLDRDYNNGWIRHVPPQLGKDLVRAPACTRAVPKLDGSFRLIADDSRHGHTFLSPTGRRPVGTNHYIRTACLPYPRTPDMLHILRDILRRHLRHAGSTLLATADSSKAFKRLRLGAGVAPCFTLQHRGAPAYSLVLNMGSTASSSFLNACSACVAASLSTPETSITAFCDDYALVTSLPRYQADQSLARLLSVLADIGMPAQALKTSPCSRSMTFAGLQIFAGSRLTAPSVSFSPKLRAKVLAGLVAVRTGSTVDPDHAGTLVGRIRWLTRLLPLLGGLLRPISQVADAATSTPRRSKRWTAHASSAAAALASLVEGCGSIPLTICPSLRGGPDKFPDIVVTIDACKLGFGFALTSLRCNPGTPSAVRPIPCSLWAAQWTHMVPDSVASEFAAACYLVKHLATFHPHSSVRILSDSTTAVAALTSFAPSASSTYANRHIADAASDIVAGRLTCSVTHLPAQHNQVADLLSRHFHEATLQPSWPSASRSITKVLRGFSRKHQDSLELSFTSVNSLPPVDTSAALPSLTTLPPQMGPRETGSRLL